MFPQFERGPWFKINMDSGFFYLPAYALGRCPEKRDFQDHCGEEYLGHEMVEGIGARLCAPDFSDHTCWKVFEDLDQAKAYLKAEYGVDPEKGGFL